MKAKRGVSPERGSGRKRPETGCAHDFYLEDDAYYVCSRCGAVMFVDSASVEELWRAFRIAVAYHADPRYSLTLLLVDPPKWFTEFEIYSEPDAE
ncbi:MAG TPA: hypothetical protein ENF73_00875 [Proteobacteria bacterium]|nr:hypothetical protein [Pseudomonadota bacterium]